MLTELVGARCKVDCGSSSVQGWQRTTSHGSVVVTSSVLFENPRMRGLGDVFQNAAKARSYLVVAADALNILPIVADVEVIDGKVD